MPADKLPHFSWSAISPSTSSTPSQLPTPESSAIPLSSVPQAALLPRSVFVRNPGGYVSAFSPLSLPALLTLLSSRTSSEAISDVTCDSSTSMLSDVTTTTTTTAQPTGTSTVTEITSLISSHDYSKSSAAPEPSAQPPWISPAFSTTSAPSAISESSISPTHPAMTIPGFQDTIPATAAASSITTTTPTTQISSPTVAPMVGTSSKKSATNTPVASYVVPVVVVMLFFLVALVFWLYKRRKGRHETETMARKAEWLEPGYVERIRQEMTAVDESKTRQLGTAATE